MPVRAGRGRVTGLLWPGDGGQGNRAARWGLAVRWKRVLAPQLMGTCRVEHHPAIKGFAVDTQVPQFDGVHHLKLPVSDLDHPEGGPRLALRPDPGKAATASGFDYFSIGVPTKAATDALSARLTQLGGTPMPASRWSLSGGFCPVSWTRTDTRSASSPRSPQKSARRGGLNCGECPAGGCGPQSGTVVTVTSQRGRHGRTMPSFF